MRVCFIAENRGGGGREKGKGGQPASLEWYKGNESGREAKKRTGVLISIFKYLYRAEERIAYEKGKKGVIEESLDARFAKCRKEKRGQGTLSLE